LVDKQLNDAKTLNTLPSKKNWFKRIAVGIEVQFE
jgi:hypothetical protein